MRLMMIGDAIMTLCQILFRIHSVEFRRPDQTVYSGPTLRRHRSRNHIIFATREPRLAMPRSVRGGRTPFPGGSAPAACAFSI